MRTLAGFLVVLSTTLPAWAQPSVLEAPPPRPRPDRHVVLEPVVGVWHHSFKDGDYTAKLGPSYGFEVVIDPFRWMNVRGGVLQGKQPIGVGSGYANFLSSDGLSVQSSFYQPSLDVLRMHMRAEPTWHYNERLSFYVGLGLGWARFTAEEPKSTPHLDSFKRTGVYLGYEGALGVAFEPILDWMVVDFSMAADYLTGQSGSIFESTQAFTEDGHRTRLDGLSKFSMGYRATLGIGIVL